MKFFYENKDLKVNANYGKRLAIGAHLHNPIELVYMIEGKTKAYIDSKEYIVGKGEVFIAFPNQIHQYQYIDHEYYFISIFPPELCPEFMDIFKHMIPVSPIVKNVSKNKKIVKTIDFIIEEKKKQTPFSNTLIKGHYLILLGELFQMMSFEPIKSANADTIKVILNYCAENYAKELKLETIAQELHISKYYISRLFSEKLHLGFNEYIGRLRVNDACNLLASADKSITEIAYTAGFNSTRSFNRLFQKYMGVSPREYKKKQFKLPLQAVDSSLK